MAPIDINNQDINSITLNGNTDVDTVTVNGQTVFSSTPPVIDGAVIDDFDDGNLLNNRDSFSTRSANLSVSNSPSNFTTSFRPPWQIGPEGSANVSNDSGRLRLDALSSAEVLFSDVTNEAPINPANLQEWFVTSDSSAAQAGEWFFLMQTPGNDYYEDSIAIYLNRGNTNLRLIKYENGNSNILINADSNQRSGFCTYGATRSSSGTWSLFFDGNFKGSATTSYIPSGTDRVALYNRDNEGFDTRFHDSFVVR